MSKQDLFYVAIDLNLAKDRAQWLYNREGDYGPNLDVAIQITKQDALDLCDHHEGQGVYPVNIVDEFSVKIRQVEPYAISRYRCED